MQLERDSIERIRTKGLNYRIVAKSALIGLFLSVPLFVLARDIAYPLELNTTSFISQVPISYWVAVFLATLALLALSVSVKTKAVLPFLVICFYFLFNSQEILFYDVRMADAMNISDYTYTIIQENGLLTPSSAEYFDYLQWPNHFTWTLILYQISKLDVSNLIKLGYTSYLLALSMSVLIFVKYYARTKSIMHIFVMSSTYMVLVYFVLNNQFVPQFLALIILFYMFRIRGHSGVKWLIIQIILFIALVLSHPFIWSFYVGAVLIQPFFEGIKNTIEIDSRRNLSLWTSFRRSMRDPSYQLKQGVQVTISNYSSIKWVASVVSIFAVYLAIFTSRFVFFQRELLIVLTQMDPRDNVSPFDLIYRLLPSPLRQYFPGQLVSPPDAETTIDLYYLVSAEIQSFTRNISLIIIVASSIILLLSHIAEKIDGYPTILPSITSFGGLYFAIGMFVEVLGARALQIIFLPLVASAELIQRKPVFGIFFVLVLLLSPGLIANSMVNQSLNGGDNTADMHTTIAAETLNTYDSPMVIQRRGNLGSSWASNVYTVDEFASQGPPDEESAILIEAPVVNHRITYLGQTCDFHASGNHVIYDNHAKGIILTDISNREYCQSRGI